MDKFFIVVADRSQLTASHRHPTAQSALTEASRLASQTGGRFFVFECLGAFEPAKPPVAWIAASEALASDSESAADSVQAAIEAGNQMALTHRDGEEPILF